ncbi:MAG TPA: hypothetical protein VFX25_04140 [Streptosporangiaceae bacterium]|nr:hypothetical protein [Streptosporangiaceae bacterium]
MSDAPGPQERVAAGKATLPGPSATATRWRRRRGRPGAGPGL